MPLATGTFAADSVTGHVAGLVAQSRIIYQIEHSAAVQAVISTLLATLTVSVVNLVLNRQRLAWRVYSDEPLDLIPEQAKSAREFLEFAIYRREDVDRTDPVTDPGIVLIRVRNSGLVTLRGAHFTAPPTFSFPGRVVIGAKVDGIDRAEVDVVEKPRPLAERQPTLRQQVGSLLRHGKWSAEPVQKISEAKGQPKNYVQLEQEGFSLRRRGRFTLIVVVSGKPARDRPPVRRRFDLVDGDIDKEGPRGAPRIRSLAVGGLTGLLLVGLILGLLLSPAPPATSTATACPGGTVTLIGSTAFSPVIREIATGYEKGCAAARIRVPAGNSGSGIGLRDLLRAGAKGHAAGLIAMSDGPALASAADRGLAGVPVAVVIYTVIVNSAVPFNNLAARDIRDIFNGRKTNWDQIHGPDGQPGPDLPIKIISREPGSGSRSTFDQRVLGDPGATVAAPGSCTSDASPRVAAGIDCVKSTGGMLQAVSAVQGAIGYAQIGDVAAYRGGDIQAVTIGGLGGRYGDIGRTAGSYPFWTVEYLYTYGLASGPEQAFLRYLGTSAAVSDLEAAQYTPCPGNGDGRAGTLCAAS